MEDFVDCIIYIMYWDINRPYIGQTTRDIQYRYRAHINDMKRGTHCNYKIQNEFNRIQVPPSIDILCKCTLDNINYLEELYIKEFDSINKGLNIISGGYSVGAGVHNSASVYTEEALVECFKMLADINNSFKCITKHTGIPTATITKIATGVQHAWLHEKYPGLWEEIKTISHKDRYKISASAI